MCRTALQYDMTLDICLVELSNILSSSNCPSNSEEIMFVKKGEEATAIQILNKLHSTEASTECRRKAVPFLCLHLFGLCVESGVSIQPTAGQCEEIRDIICQEEWEVIAGDIPDCVTFPSASTSSCTTINNFYTTNGTITGNMPGN